MAAVEAMTKSGEEEEEKKSVMVVGIDDSDVSFYALQWTLDHFFSPPPQKSNNINFKLVIVHAKPVPTSVVSFAGPGAADVVPYIESDLRKTAARVLQKAKELCAAHSVGDVLLEVVEGDARNVLCEAVEKHHADMLVVGSHGYGAIKRCIKISKYMSAKCHMYNKYQIQQCIPKEYIYISKKNNRMQLVLIQNDKSSRMDLYESFYYWDLGMDVLCYILMSISLYRG